ncbi:MAG: suppressor of fused domain protein [Deltaproteobacteria bacterium]|nr:suppressor of fused domain protein [Deltaproteobacteria bacterium]
MSELLESINPFDTAQVIVSAHDTALYMYLRRAPDMEVTSVWIRNLRPAPEALDVEGLRRGKPPCNPRQQCRSPEAGAIPDPDALRVVWLPGGNGVALYEGDVLLAIIPPWSGQEGFNGYAREAVGTGPMAWELRPDNALIERFRDAERYWAAWEAPDFWTRHREALVRQYERAFGPSSNYYAADGGEWPPRAITRIPHEDGVLVLTVGISLLQQPGVEGHADLGAWRRIELGAYLPGSWPEASVKRFLGYLAAQTNLPWQHSTWLGPGHTVPCDAWKRASFDTTVLVEAHPALAPVRLDEVDKDPVNLLWLLPLTSDERDEAEARGSDVVVAKLNKHRWREA